MRRGREGNKRRARRGEKKRRKGSHTVASRDCHKIILLVTSTVETKGAEAEDTISLITPRWP
jgi:hypothetical protein